MSDSLKIILIASLTLFFIVFLLVLFRMAQLNIIDEIDWSITSDIFLPLVVALLSAFIAYQALKTSRMTLQANDSPRLYNNRITVNVNNDRVKVTVKVFNYGKSPALKTYFLLKYDKEKANEYHLSKPKTVYPNGEVGTELLVVFPNNQEQQEIYESLIKAFKGVTEEDVDTMSSNFTLFVFTYDFFGRFYYKEEKVPYKNDHLIKGYKPFKLVEKDNKQSKLIKYYWDEAISQKNTYKHKEEFKKRTLKE